MNKKILESKNTDIVIISYNTAELTLNCIDSIIKTAGDLIAQIIVVDNASTDESVAKIRKDYPQVVVIENPENYGYAKAVNIGVNYSKNQYVIISNPDVLFEQMSIYNLIDNLEFNSKVGVTGPQQIFPNGDWQASFGELPGIKLGIQNLFLITHIRNFKEKLFFHEGWGGLCPKETPYIDGAVMAVRKTAFDDVGGFDEDYFFFTEEADFCYKLNKKGWKIVHVPDAVVKHYRGASFVKSDINPQRYRMLINTKALYCKKNLPFQEAKFYMICEIVYSLNMSVLWSIIGLFLSGSRKVEARGKAKIFNLFFKFWIDEFKIFVKGNEK